MNTKKIESKWETKENSEWREKLEDRIMMKKQETQGKLRDNDKYY